MLFADFPNSILKFTFLICDQFILFNFWSSFWFVKIADGLKNFLDTTGDLCVSSEILGVDQILNSTQLVPGNFNATALLEVSDDLSNMLESSTVSYLGNVTLPCAQVFH